MTRSVNTALDSILENLVKHKTNEQTGVTAFHATKDETDLQRIKEKAKKAPDTKKTEAARLGTHAHATIDALVRGESVSELDLQANPIVRNIVSGFRQWQGDYGITLSPRGDTKVFSETYGFSGAMDAFGWNKDGEIVVVDFKTSNGV